MLIATFNCNSLRARLEHVLDWLADNAPLVLALQETKVQDKDFPVAALARAGWEAVYRGGKSYNGVALLSRRRPDEHGFGFGPGADDESCTRLVWARFGELHVVNTYVPQGRSLEHAQFEHKLEWLRRLLAFFRERYDPASDLLAWVGDINIAPRCEDVHDHKRIWPHVCHCPETTAAFDRFLAWGLTDVFRKHLPEPGNFTFWDYRVRAAVDRGLGWRIDHVLATAPLARASRCCWVDLEARRRPRPSDHTFVAAEFDLPV